jgi:hypothetical protein
MESNMAAQLKKDGRHLSVRVMRNSDFNKLNRDCSAPPAPSESLLAFVASAKKMLQKE